MSKLVRTAEGRVVAFGILPVLGLFAALLFVQRAESAPYTNPFWANNSTWQESAIPSVANRSMSPEGVDMRTGELFWDHFLFRMPGVRHNLRFALRWRSMVSGASQFGRQILPSFETTAQYVVINQQNPNGPGGHAVDIRRPSGRIDRFTFHGTGYTAPADVFDTLTVNGGAYNLADKWGGFIRFNLQGMQAFTDDRFGNRIQFTHNAAFQLTGLVDDRGQSYSLAHNASGYVSSITDPASRTWTFTYDSTDNLKTITTPGTADQPNGIVTTFNYDLMNRLVSVTDGRGNTVWSFAYFGATGQISSVTIDGDTVYYTYAPGLTTRTDRNGNVHRIYHTGQQVTKTDMLVGGQSKYKTLFRYTGVFPANLVRPRGNRIDFTFDASGNLTGRRHRTTDTATNDPADIVHAWVYNASNFPTSYTDPRGNQWTYGYDVNFNLTSVTHPTVSDPVTQTASRSHTYNTKGQRTGTTDEEGNTTRYTYFAIGASKDLLQKIEVDPFGLDLETAFTYDAAGNVLTRTTPRGDVWTNTWDNLRRRTKQEAPAPLGYEVTYTFDGNGNVTKKEVENVDKNGTTSTTNPWFTTTYTWTNTDHLATLTEEIDASTTRDFSFDYDANQNRVRVTKPEGNKEAWDFDERDRVIRHTRGETDPDAANVEYAYDENDNRITFTDGRGNDTDFTFDLFDRRTKVTNALSHFTEWEYDVNSNVTKILKKDSGGNVLQRETYLVDQRNRRWKISRLFRDPSTTHADSVMTFERLKTGQVEKVTDPRSKVTTHVYDNALRRTKTTDAMGNEWSYTLDKSGNLTAWSIKEIDGAGSVIHDFEATYDEIGRRKTLVEIDRNNSSNRLTTTTEYDSRSNVVFRTNAEGNPQRWTFDGLSRMVKHERALTTGATIEDFTAAQVTSWGFDKNSRLVSHKDDSPDETKWEYDALDRRTKQIYADNTSITWEYDDAGNVTKLTDAAGNVIADTFDVLNRNTSRSITLATGFVGTTSETRVYDALNRILSNADNDYQVEYAYADLGFRSLVSSEKQSYVGGIAYPKTVTKTYDASGNRVTEAYPAGANLSLAYTYNDIDNLTEIGDGTNAITTYSWIGLRRKQTTFQNGATATNHYGGFRQEIESLRHETSAQASIVRLDYGYDKVHDKTYERFGAAGANGDAFAYDKLRRLTNAWMGSTSVTAPGGAAYTKKIDYNYDDDGNRTSVVVTPYQQTATTTSYTTNNLNEYTQVAGTNRTHDANGNLTDDGTFTFAYDYKNLIVEVTRKSDSVVMGSYRYDAEGRRVEKSTADGVRRYIRSRLRGNGTTRGSGAGGRYSMSHVVSVYDDADVWKQNFVWADTPDSVEMLEQADILDHDADANTSEKTRSYYHRNVLGSVVEISDALEATVASYRYDPYGNMTITRGGTVQTVDPLNQPWGYTGRFHDAESGLWYYRARYYDSTRGRFLQRDPLGYRTGSVLFAYASSNPVGRIDPRGTEDMPAMTFPGDGGSPPPADDAPAGSTVDNPKSDDQPPPPSSDSPPPGSTPDNPKSDDQPPPPSSDSPPSGSTVDNPRSDDQPPSPSNESPPPGSTPDNPLTTSQAPSSSSGSGSGDDGPAAPGPPDRMVMPVPSSALAAGFAEMLSPLSILERAMGINSMRMGGIGGGGLEGWHQHNHH